MGIRRGPAGNTKQRDSWKYLNHRRPSFGVPSLVSASSETDPPTFPSSVVCKGRQTSQEDGSFSLAEKKRQLPQEPKFYLKTPKVV